MLSGAGIIAICCRGKEDIWWEVTWNGLTRSKPGILKRRTSSYNVAPWDPFVSHWAPAFFLTFPPPFWKVAQSWYPERRRFLNGRRPFLPMLCRSMEVQWENEVPVLVYLQESERASRWKLPRAIPQEARLSYCLGHHGRSSTERPKCLNDPSSSVNRADLQHNKRLHLETSWKTSRVANQATHIHPGTFYKSTNRTCGITTFSIIILFVLNTLLEKWPFRYMAIKTTVTSTEVQRRTLFKTWWTTGFIRS